MKLSAEGPNASIRAATFLRPTRPVSSFLLLAVPRRQFDVIVR